MSQERAIQLSRTLSKMAMDILDGKVMADGLIVVLAQNNKDGGIDVAIAADGISSENLPPILRGAADLAEKPDEPEAQH